MTRMPTPGWNLPYGVSSRDFDDPPEPADPGECPVCKGETWNGTPDDDEDGVSWTWKACDECAAGCTCCGEVDCEKDADGYCSDCNTNSSEDLSWATVDRARKLLAATRALLARTT